MSCATEVNNTSILIRNFLLNFTIATKKEIDGGLTD